MKDIEAARDEAKKQAAALTKELEDSKKTAQQVRTFEVYVYGGSGFIWIHGQHGLWSHTRCPLLRCPLCVPVVNTRASVLVFISSGWLYATQPVLLHTKPANILSPNATLLSAIRLSAAHVSCAQASSSQTELTKLQATQAEMANKLAAAERELAQLRTTSRSAEFELVGKQQVRGKGDSDNTTGQLRYNEGRSRHHAVCVRGQERGTGYTQTQGLEWDGICWDCRPHNLGCCASTALLYCCTARCAVVHRRCET